MVLILVITPFVFFLTVWVLVSFYRVMRPDEPRIPSDVLLPPITLDPARYPVLVGARAIRETGRRDNRIRSLASPYDFLDGHSEGFPEAWWQDVVMRRN